MTIATQEKYVPVMWFPRKCRHTYQIVKTDRPQKVAYFVALREVSFHRRDFTVEFDEPFYVGSLDDEFHADSNEFDQNDWRFVVTP